MTMDRLRSISPTTPNQLIACPAKVYLDSSSVRPRTSSPIGAALLGTVVHRTLELLVAGGLNSSRTSCPKQSTGVGPLHFREAGLEDERKATRLPGYFLKKARVLNAAKKTRRLLAGRQLSFQRRSGWRVRTGLFVVAWTWLRPCRTA